MSKISDMRENYDRATLDEEHVDVDAIQQFNVWFQEARDEEVVEPNAMIMSTINKEGHPTSRTLLLKGVEENGFVFFTNYNSDKGQEIANNPNICLLFLWKKVQRQVRISGVAQKISKEESEAYFHSRPKGSQIGAWASPQSQVIADKSVLETRTSKLIEKYKDVDELPLPDFWGGYIMKPQSMEFWQGRPNRLHDRLRYTLVDGNWKIERLAP